MNDKPIPPIVLELGFSALPLIVANYGQRYGVNIVIGGPSAYTDGENKPAITSSDSHSFNIDVIDDFFADDV